MTDNTYTPRHSGTPKHLSRGLNAPRPMSRRARREARLAEERATLAAQSLALPERAPVTDGSDLFLKLRISDLEKAKEYIDSEIAYLKRELS